MEIIKIGAADAKRSYIEITQNGYKPITKEAARKESTSLLLALLEYILKSGEDKKSKAGKLSYNNINAVLDERDIEDKEREARYTEQ